jgi:hypothetical protein
LEWFGFSAGSSLTDLSTHKATKDVTMAADPNTAKRLMEAVERRAMEIIELPAAEREALYAENKKLYFESGVLSGMNDAQAKEASEKMDEFTRALVLIIESGGGGSGGKA